MKRRPQLQLALRIAVFVLTILLVSSCGGSSSSLITPPNDTRTEAGNASSNDDNQNDSTNPDASDESTGSRSPEPPELPGAPEVLITESNGAFAVEIDPQNDDSTPSPNGWEVRWRETATDSWSAWTQKSDLGETYTASTLTNGTQYDVQARLTFEGDLTSQIAESSATPFTTPGAITASAIELDAGNTTINVDVTPPNDGGRPITGYKYWFRPTGTTDWYGGNTASSPSFKISGFNNRQEYEIKVAAVNEAGEGDSVTGKATPDWTVRVLTPSETSVGGFGADLGASGDHLIVTSDPSSGSSEVTFFQRNGTEYIEKDVATGSNVGGDIAIDGNTAATEVWFPNPRLKDLGRRARVFTFDEDGPGWTRHSDIKIDWGPAGRFDEYALDLHNDRLVIAGHNQGKLQVFERDSSGIWNGQNIISDRRNNAFTLFGKAAAIHGDFLVAGAPGKNSRNNTFTGQVYLYTYSKKDNTWSYKATFSDDTTTGQFGVSLDLTSQRLVVGAPEANKVYVYEREGGGFSSQAQVIDKPAGVSGKGFGRSVSSSGELIAIGLANSSGDGSTFVYKKQSNGDWGNLGELINGRVLDKADPGRHIVLNGDRLYVDATPEPNLNNPPMGSVYVFEDLAGSE